VFTHWSYEVRTADGYIINKCLNGDSAAFGLLVDKYKEGVYALAYSKLRNFHDAEDVTQEVFIKAYKKLHTLRQYDSFHAWLYAATSNLCKDWIRMRSRRPDNEFIEDKDPETLETPSVDSYREDRSRESLRESLQEALDSLPEIYRQVLALRFLGGMSCEEIASFLGISTTAIWKRLSRARAQLKEEMIEMMSAEFERHGLRGGFTFRIVEAVKHIRIHPASQIRGLPWGLSAAAGVILTLLSFNPHTSLLNPSGFHKGSPLPAEMKVLRTGEIPFDVLKISQMSAIASKQGCGDSGGLRPADEHGAFLLAPQASEVKLEPGNGAANDWFGGAVAIQGDYAIVGAPGKDDKKGVAYIFKRDGNSWKEQETLFARDGNKEDYFGYEVAISGEFAFVGAPNDDDRGEDTGSVYIFRRTGESWMRQAKLNPHGGAILWCYFGYCVAIQGDYLVVGSPQEEWAGGAIYIFKRDGDVWNEQAKLKSSNWAQRDNFGHAVSISGDYVIATAHRRNNNTGYACVFKRDGDFWKEQAILTADDGKADEYFGRSASISGDYAIVGADFHNGRNGAAYIFVRDGTSWKQQAKILPDDLTRDNYFGVSVCISGDRAVVGSPWDGGNNGAIYGFMRDGDSWKQVSKQTASDGLEGDVFGFDVAFSGNYAITGANGADVNGVDSGAAYIYNCAEDLSFPAFPVENSGFSTTTFGGEKNKSAMHDPVIPPPDTAGAYSNTSAPKEFRLLQNFPNPFNPETWIPFSLPESEHVTIRIYSLTGGLVRTLDLGQKLPGAYLSKEKAAYWDGRNETGELVTSGAYFCVMKAGKSEDLKKMVMAR